MIATGNVSAPIGYTHGLPVPTAPIPRPGNDIVSRIAAAQEARATRPFRLLNVNEPDRFSNPTPAVTTPAPKRVRVSHASHGTMSGYRTHYRHGETPCDDCRKANADNSRQRRERLRGGPPESRVTFDLDAAIRYWQSGNSIRATARAFGIANPTMQHHVNQWRAAQDQK